jgi:hypothetical protein
MASERRKLEMGWSRVPAAARPIIAQKFGYSTCLSVRRRLLMTYWTSAHKTPAIVWVMLQRSSNFSLSAVHVCDVPLIAKIASSKEISLPKGTGIPDAPSYQGAWLFNGRHCQRNAGKLHIALAFFIYKRCRLSGGCTCV